MTNNNQTIFGIDLGTTFSCIAYVDETGREVVVRNFESELTTPSVILFEGDERIVGRAAKEAAVVHTDRVVQFVKRHMGTDYLFHYDGDDYRPEEISSFILRKLVSDAEQATGLKVTDVVITCPAYFGIEEREATAKAGEIAGLNVRSIINEPTAAAICYGLHQDLDQTVLVYDLGGGTFDITMIEISEGNIRVVCTGGDHNLGGKDWDDEIVAYLASKWQEETGSSEDPLSSPETYQDILDRTERAKITLSTREQASVRITHEGETVTVELTRDKFDELTAGLLERTIEYTHDMLDAAEKRNYTSYDQILLVGGSTKMPQVSKRLEQEFGIVPKTFDPDLSVAKGAAIYGHKLAIDEAIKHEIVSLTGKPIEGVPTEDIEPEVLDKAREKVAEDSGLRLGQVVQMSGMTIVNVTSRSFGVIAIDRTPTGDKEIVSNLIMINDPVPAETTQNFGTLEANQPMVDVQIVENLHDEAVIDPELATEIGTAQLKLPPGLPANSPIEITFRLDEQGRLHGRAVDKSTGNDVKVEIETKRVIPKEELEAAKSRATQLVVS